MPGQVAPAGRGRARRGSAPRPGAEPEWARSPSGQAAPAPVRRVAGRRGDRRCSPARAERAPGQRRPPRDRRATASPVGRQTARTVAPGGGWWPLPARGPGASSAARAAARRVRAGSARGAPASRARARPLRGPAGALAARQEGVRPSPREASAREEGPEPRRASRAARVLAGGDGGAGGGAASRVVVALARGGSGRDGGAVTRGGSGGGGGALARAGSGFHRGPSGSLAGRGTGSGATAAVTSVGRPRAGTLTDTSTTCAPERQARRVAGERRAAGPARRRRARRRRGVARARAPPVRGRR